jgi:hypothetical protein
VEDDDVVEPMHAWLMGDLPGGVSDGPVAVCAGTRRHRYANGGIGLAAI